MARQRVLDKTFTVKDGIVRISESIEKELSGEELMMEKQQYQQRKQQIVYQMNSLKDQYDELTAAEEEIDNMLLNFPKFGNVGLPNIPTLK